MAESQFDGLKLFYSERIEVLFSDEAFRKAVVRYAYNDVLPQLRSLGKSEREVFNYVFFSHVEEAELTLSLINDESLHVNKKTALLEVGGGLGLVYAFLKIKGYNISALEPSKSGFDYYDAAVRLFKVLNIDDSGFYRLDASSCGQINRVFDVIFSNNVLEHVQDLKGCFLSLRNVLAVDGIMVHNTVNYNVPYEAHFKTWLVPFLPRLTQLFRPALRSSELWRGLNFITTGKIKKIARGCGLEVSFYQHQLIKAFRRLETDEQFAERQGAFTSVYKLLKRAGLVRVFDCIPLAFTTPIKFKMSRKLVQRPRAVLG